MRQHSVRSTRAEPRSPEDETAEHPGEQPQPMRMVPVAGLAVRRRPVETSDPPAIRRTLVDNSGPAPVNITTEAQLQNYPWWNSLTEPQQMHLLARIDPELAAADVHQALASVPRRAVTGGMDLINAESWGLIAQLVEQYADVVCADPVLNVALTTTLKQKKGLDFSNVRQLLQQAAPGARNADIFIIHPGPWIYTANTLHQDLQAVMTPGCVAYVLTDNEGGNGGQAATLVQGLTQLGGFTVTVQDLAPDPEGMVSLATGPQNDAVKVQPYHSGGFKLVRIAA